MNVFGLPLITPRDVAAAAMKRMPMMTIGLRTIGTIKRIVATIDDDANFQGTMFSRRRGDAEMRAVVPARRSREAMSAMKIAAMANVIGSDFGTANAAMVMPISAMPANGVIAKVIIASVNAA